MEWRAGNTSLHDASEAGHLSILELLVSRGACMQPDIYGTTPLLAAALCGNTRVCASRSHSNATIRSTAHSPPLQWFHLMCSYSYLCRCVGTVLHILYEYEYLYFTVYTTVFEQYLLLLSDYATPLFNLITMTLNFVLFSYVFFPVYTLHSVQDSTLIDLSNYSINGVQTCSF